MLRPERAAASLVFVAVCSHVSSRPRPQPRGVLVRETPCGHRRMDPRVQVQYSWAVHNRVWSRLAEDVKQIETRLSSCVLYKGRLRSELLDQLGDDSATIHHSN